MTMVVRLGNHWIENPSMIFKNKYRNYSIHHVPNDVPGVSYRTDPIVWMDRKVTVQYLMNICGVRPLPNNETRYLFCDNCGGHSETEECDRAVTALNTKLYFHPANSTHCTQPDDSFVISKVKDVWKHMWDLEEIKMIQDGKWSNDKCSDCNWSGKLKNPGKATYLN